MAYAFRRENKGTPSFTGPDGTRRRFPVATGCAPRSPA